MFDALHVAPIRRGTACAALGRAAGEARGAEGVPSAQVVRVPPPQRWQSRHHSRRRQPEFHGV